MSRVIVKNLPSKITEDKLRAAFSSIGTITDLTLKYKNGVFRKFGFVGFQVENEALDAIRRLNNTFIGTSKIQVEKCHDLNATDKPRPWSKYAPGSSAFKKKKLEKAPALVSPPKEKSHRGSRKVDEMLGELNDDAEFAEFLAVHESRQKKSLWADDTVIGKAVTSRSASTALHKDSDDGDSDDYDDMPTAAKSADKGDDRDSDEDNDKSEEPPQPTNKPTPYILKMKGVPMHCKDKTIRDFFQPLKISSIRIARNKQKKAYGLAYVSFATPADAREALSRDKNTLGDKKVSLKVANADTADWNTKADRYEKVSDDVIADTGRLYVRNLSYTSSVEALEELFSQFGLITEVHLPVDKFTRKLKGFAFVTFMFPEHAFKAYTSLDGTIYQGRILHILPAKEKVESEETQNATFKQKKAAEKKALAGSSHNWNALFLGANAVAEAMAEKFGMSKSDILTESKQSLGVRMALGETQLVSETRQFLEDNGVVLDAFGQANAPRSRTVILAKNLPAGTTSDDVREVFAKHCVIDRLILPPSGLTALIECQDPTEAKNTFKRLAYTKFKHVPLYLEWAPVGVLVAKVTQESVKTWADADSQPDAKEKPSETKVTGDENDEDVEPESCLFIKNLNFNTEEKSLEKVFKKCGVIKSVTISRKLDPRNKGQLLSMGYGFVQFWKRASAQKALKELQHTELDGHTIELKVSTGRAVVPNVAKRKLATVQKQTSSKILIRNIPFEAKKQEIEELFKVFGEIKITRLPKKLSGTGSHRGFGFVDFVSKQDAKRALETLCHSTHLYGRRLILEWADEDESIDVLREKTAKQFFDEGPHKKRRKKEFEDDLKLSKSYE